MDFELIWTEPAAEQLEKIIRYIAADQPVAAERIRADMPERVESLSRQPLIGSIYEKDRKGRTREMLCGKYRIFYRVDDAARRAEILTVWHSARREPRLPR